MDVVVQGPLVGYPDLVAYVDKTELDVYLGVPLYGVADLVAYGGFTFPATSVASGGGPQAAPIGLALETDIAFALGRRKSRPIGLALEVDGAFALGARKSRSIGLATEVDVAFALSPSAGGPVEVALPRYLGLNPLLKNRRKKYSLGS